MAMIRKGQIQRSADAISEDRRSSLPLCSIPPHKGDRIQFIPVLPTSAIVFATEPADPLLKFLGIGLDPTEDRCVADLDAAVEEHQFEIAVAEGKHQIPTNGPQDHLAVNCRP